MKITERILVPKSQRFVTNSRAFYRYHNDTLFQKTSWQVFGPYFAQIVWAKQQIVVTHSATLADAQRAIFDELWNGAKPFSNAQWDKIEKWQASPPKSV